MHKPEMSNRQSFVLNHFLEIMFCVSEFKMNDFFCLFFFSTPWQQRKSSECSDSGNRVKSSSVSLSDRKKVETGCWGAVDEAALSNPTGPHIAYGSSLQ